MDRRTFLRATSGLFVPVAPALIRPAHALVPEQQQVVPGGGLSWLPKADGRLPSNYADYTTTGGLNHFYVNGLTQATPEAWWAARAALPGGSGGVFSRASVANGVAPGSLLLTSYGSGIPRDNVADPSTGKLLGRQYEGARTNIVLQSNSFSTSWTSTGLASIAQNVTGVDGTTSAWMLTPKSGSNSANILFTSSAVAITSGGDVVTTIYGQGLSGRYLLVNLQASTNNWASAIFDLKGGAGNATQTAVGTTSGTIISATLSVGPGGFFQAKLVASVTSTTAFVVFGPATAATGNSFTAAGQVTATYAGTETVALTDAQLENNVAFPSSYIATTSSSAARAADSQTLTRAAPTSITKVIAGRTGQNSAAQPVFWDLSDGTNSNDINLFWSVSGHLILQTKASGTTRNTDLGVVVAPNTDFVLAFSVGANGTTASLNGAATVNTASATFPAASMTSELEGQWQGGAEPLFSTVARTAEWTNYAASNSALQALSLRMANP